MIADDGSSMHPTVYALSLFTPSEIDAQKVRIGSRHDGGYVLCDKFDKSQNVISFGVDGNASFDLDLALRGHKVFLFDHTIAGPPVDHENFSFFKEGICGSNTSDKDLFTLAQHAERHSIDLRDAIMKVDVEGAEWDALLTMGDEVLSTFSQIVVEFHHITNVSQPNFRARLIEALEKINRAFVIFHVHINNCAMPRFVDGLVTPEVLEVSYINRKLVTSSPSRTMYPTSIDYANDRTKPDCLMTFFPFLPATTEDVVSDSLKHILDEQLKVKSGWL